jgi:hypothetical protein
MLHSPQRGWMQLARIQKVVERDPTIRRAVRCLSLRDQLELTLELLGHADWFNDEHTDALPPNVVPFRPRRAR